MAPAEYAGSQPVPSAAGKDGMPVTGFDAVVARCLDRPGRGRFEEPLLLTAGGRQVTAARFRDGPARRMVIAGVHGSERSGVAVAEQVATLLASGRTAGADTLMITDLFPDNGAAGLREGAIPTNRNFPPRGRAADPADPRDALGRPILPENRLLLALIAAFRPDRILSLHATVHPERAGIFADPHAGPGGPPDAGASAADAALALDLARHVRVRGARVPGNDLDGAHSSLWSGEVDDGVSLGGWAPCPIRTDDAHRRPSIGVITVEIDGLHRADAAEARADRGQELDAFADAIVTRFLPLPPQPVID